MALKKCIECGGTVSDTALACPHCQGNWRGANCAACGISMRLSDEAVQIPWSRDYEGLYVVYLHETCLLVLLPDRDVPCQDCGALINLRAHGLALCGLGAFKNSQGDTWDVPKPWPIPYVHYRPEPRSCPKCGSQWPIDVKGIHGPEYKRCGKCHLPNFNLNRGTLFRKHKLCHDCGGFSEE